MALAKYLTLLAAVFAASTLRAQQPPVPSNTAHFTDPANLRGERVKPRDGRELPIDQGARGLQQMLRKLNTRASLMLIVAHPDDEDGGMLTYYSRGLGARVAVLTLTRGEGGQNAMTGDFEDALGLLRTQELLSANRYLGVDQFFGTEVDFGFSKTKEESFAKWTHERVLYDAVRSIRLYRPLVIAAVFIGGVTDGHGQHQVSGQVAQEAFKAAADPTVFPDMIAEGILPWQALKVYARVPTQSITDKGLFDYATGKYTAPRFENYVTGEVTTTPPSVDVVVHEGTVDPVLSDSPSDPPRTYVQFARIGLGLQKSQIGPNVRLPPAGVFDVSYHLYGSVLSTRSKPFKARHPERSAQRGVEGPASPPVAARPHGPSSHDPESASFFDGIDTSIEGIADLAPGANASLRINLAALQTSVQETTQRFSSTRPQDLASSLATSIKRFDMVIKVVEAQVFDSSQKATVLHELEIKRVQLNDALALALGLTMTAQTPAIEAITGTTIDARVSLTQASQMQIAYDTVMSGNSSGEGIQEGTGMPSSEPHLAFGHPLQTECGLGPNLTAAVTRPYFFRSSIEKPVYELIDLNLRNAPGAPPALTCFVQLSYNDAPLTIGAIAEHEGQPLQLVPPFSLTLSSKAQILLRYREPGFFITATVKSAAIQPELKVQLTGPKGWPISRYSSPSPSQTEFKIIEPRGPELPKAGIFSASASVPDAGTYSDGYRGVGYPGLVSTNYFTPATDRVVPVELRLPQGHPEIGYLPGTGDAIPAAIESLDFNPITILTVADLTTAKLARYDTVILGVRTYNAHPDLHGAPTQALLDYARNGGNVVVQYQSGEFTAADAPYPLALGSNEKVVDETDPVQLLDNSAAFLTTPNKITPADFNNWVEERGHGFLSTWDSHYTALTETHDPDQNPQRGGLITTQLGKGRWTYCAFALYRQLPEAVPGAYRLFVNLLNPAVVPKP